MKSAVVALDSVPSSSLQLVSVPRPATARLPSFDYLRVFVIFLVVLHHAAFAYCTDGHPPHGGSYTSGSAPIVDVMQWQVFNAVVTWNDNFFMPLMFLLAGLFVRPSLERKELGRYLVDRALRLGVPLLVGVVTVVPLSYYASYLQSGGTMGFGGFWAHMVTQGPWPSGPMWFVGALLAFDFTTVLVLTRVDVRPLAAALDRLPPVTWFLLFLGLAALAYLPLRALVGPSFWLTAGPFGIQASRIGLYAFFFVAGVIVGANRLAVAFDRHWLRWSALSAVATALQVGVHWPAWANGAVTVLFASTMTAGLLALAIRFGRQRSVLGDSLSANAYGIYLLHWPIVLWLQYALLRVRLGVIEKSMLVLATGFGLSWIAASVLRRVPGIARVV